MVQFGNAPRPNCLQVDAITVRQSPLPVILLFVVFVGLCDGVAQGAIFGDVALLPPKYTQVLLPPCLLPCPPGRPRTSTHNLFSYAEQAWLPHDVSTGNMIGVVHAEAHKADTWSCPLPL